MNVVILKPGEGHMIPLGPIHMVVQEDVCRVEKGKNSDPITKRISIRGTIKYNASVTCRCTTPCGQTT